MNKNHLRTARPVAKLTSGRSDWYRIVNSVDAARAEVYIYDEIGYFGTDAASFVDQLKGIGPKPIDLHLNSPGGEVYDGIAIHTAISEHPGDTTVYVDGLAASAASFIAMAGNRVVMAKHAEMMIHDAMGLTIGNAGDHEKMVADLNRISDNIAGMYADKAGGTAAEWRAKMLAETWFSADEAVSAGLADEVAGSPKAGEVDDSFDLSVFKYAKRSQAPAPVVDEEYVIDPEVIRAAFRKEQE